MKKVVKDNPKYYYMDCYKCGCQFSYELKDIQLNIQDDEFEVKCPICDFPNYHRCRLIYKESDKEEKNKKGE